MIQPDSMFSIACNTLDHLKLDFIIASHEILGRIVRRLPLAIPTFSFNLLKCCELNPDVVFSLFISILWQITLDMNEMEIFTTVRFLATNGLRVCAIMQRVPLQHFHRDTANSFTIVGQSFTLVCDSHKRRDKTIKVSIELSVNCAKTSAKTRFLFD